MLPFSELEPSYNPLYPRANTLAWFPRWFEGYYSNDTLRKLHYILLVNQKNNFVDPCITPNFYKPIKEPRLAYIAEYPNLDQESLTIEVSHPGGVNLAVKEVFTLGTFLAEHKDPIFFVDAGLIFLRNISNHTYLVNSNSGYINISTALSSGVVSDSYFLVENPSGDRTVIPRISSLIKNSTGIVSSDSDIPYLVTYQNQTRHNALLAGSGSVLRINDVPVPVKEYSLSNSFDKHAFLVGLKRNRNENNFSLRGRSQYSSVARTTINKISAALGLASFYQWSSFDVANFSGSGWFNLEVLNLPKKEFIREKPFYTSNNSLYFSKAGSGAVLLVNGKIQDPATFNFTNGQLTFVGSGLGLVNPESIELNYIKQNYNATYNTSGIASLTSDVSPRTNIVLLTKGVRLGRAEVKIKSFPWDRDIGLIKEGAVFE